MPNTLLIVEESLRDLKAHWFEYIKTIASAAEAENWSVEVACHQDVVSEIQTALSVFPVFQHARYLDNAKQKLPGERFYGFILHSWRCLNVLTPLLHQQPRYDHIFVPTVLIHHLLAWWVIMTFHPNRPHHLTLFFVTNPGVWDPAHQTSRLPKSAQLQGFLLKWFSRLVQQQRVTLAVETQGARQEFEQLTGLPFSQFPHPVPEVAPASQSPQNAAQHRIFACYGFARYEKGSDLLKTAITTWLDSMATTAPNPEECLICQSPPYMGDLGGFQRSSNSMIHPPLQSYQLNYQSDAAAHFRIQWTEPFSLPDGKICEPDDLWNYPQVKVIDRPLLTEDYQALLQTTECMILPYRNSSYYARVSRIAIEAAYLGIPLIYTKGGWLEELAQEFGAGIGVEDESVESLITAIDHMLSHYEQYRQQALAKQEKARQYFSGKNFCQMLLHPCHS